jgi:hypothetical protein
MSRPLAKIVRGVLESVGLFCRSKQVYISRRDLHETWVALGRGWPRPRRGSLFREVISSFDVDVLDYYFATPLSTVDYPRNRFPVRSALFLGYPLREILSYYSHNGIPLKTDMIEKEVEEYRAFARVWGGK